MPNLYSEAAAAGSTTMKCPICDKDQLTTGEFYDHMGEIHGWKLSEAEKYADDRWLETHPMVAEEYEAKQSSG